MLLRKGIYPYEYMESWERFDETIMPNKKVLYNSLNMHGVINVDYRHAKRVFKNFINKKIGDYIDFYVQSDTLFLAESFENLRN